MTSFYIFCNPDQRFSRIVPPVSYHCCSMEGKGNINFEIIYCSLYSWIKWNK